MAGKKKIQKAQKTSKNKKEEEDVRAPEVQKTIQSDAQSPKGSEKNEEKNENQVNFFSNSFYARLERFKRFNQIFLVLKNGDEEELTQTNKRVSQKMEELCSIVLKEGVKDAEKWISNQQLQIHNQIIATNQALQSTKQALMEAKSFSEQELAKQIAPIEEKRQKLEKTLEQYETMKDRARRLYTDEGLAEA